MNQFAKATVNTMGQSEPGFANFYGRCNGSREESSAPPPAAPANNSRREMKGPPNLDDILNDISGARQTTIQLILNFSQTSAKAIPIYLETSMLIREEEVMDLNL